MRECIKIFFINYLIIFAGNIYANSVVTFASEEHIFMGDQVTLQGVDQSTQNKPNKFLLSNGLQLTYGEILAMPDYYGEENNPISSETTFFQRKARFQRVFSEFDHSDVNYFNTFWPIIQNERAQIMQAIKMHQDVSKIYAQITDKENVALSIATHMHYLALAENGYDHFNNDAMLAYQAGHSVAIDTAIHAYDIQMGHDQQANQTCYAAFHSTECLSEIAKKTLILAYEQNAFASHFLSDRFAGGHIRTPFRALLETRPIRALATLSANLMHGEDNQSGVIVTNKTGKIWMAYGDGYYFSPQNEMNRYILQKVLQQSADEIYAAYQLGVGTDVMSHKTTAWIPTPLPAGEIVHIKGVGFVQQTAPLYQVLSGIVCQRIDVNNHYDDQWTPIWATIVTLLIYHEKQSFKLPLTWQLILHQNHLDDILQQLGTLSH